jgi:hypothetical protein
VKAKAPEQAKEAKEALKDKAESAKKMANETTQKVQEKAPQTYFPCPFPFLIANVTVVWNL